jgi:putative transposase
VLYWCIMDTKSTSHCTFNIWYHLVWCPKYRRSPFKGAVETALKEILVRICQSQAWELAAIEVMPDHVHLFLSSAPTSSPSQIVTRLKSVSAIELYRRFPWLRKRLFWGGILWSKGYYVGTAGTVTSETVLRYIANQKGS